MAIEIIIRRLVITGCTFYAFWFLFIDSPLSKETQAMLKSAQPIEYSDGFIYLLGIGAEIDKSPIAEGKGILEKIRIAETDYPKITDFDDSHGFKHSSTLKFPKPQSQFCNLRKGRECLEEIFTTDNEAGIEAHESIILRQRFSEFLSKTNFESMQAPHFYEAIIGLTELKGVARLRLLHSIAQAKNCCPEEAAKKIHSDIEKIKKYLERSNRIIDKITAYKILNVFIESLFKLNREYELKGDLITPLTAKQLDMNEAFINDFAVMKSTADILSKTKIIQKGRWSWVPTWSERIIFKKNISLNQAIKTYKSAILISQSQQAKFKEKMNSHKKLQHTTSNNFLRNIFGMALLDMHLSGDILPYVSRGFDINAKIHLYNQLVNTSDIHTNQLKLSNPYFPENLNSASYNKDDHSICLKGPLEDTRKFRCLYL